jgi:superfamily II DNA or RNA helicase
VTGLIYCGLIRQIYRFAERKGYKIELMSDNIIPRTPKNDVELNLTLTPRDYQQMAYEYGVENHRAVFVSPTASGKSLIIFMLAQYHMRHDRNILVIVPTTSLVFQMKTDFEKYSTESLDIHCISDGAKKESESPIIISTWQSIYKNPAEYFEQFDFVFGDEAHLFKAKSLTTIMTGLTNASYRIGCTGTLDGTQTHKLVLEGLFGPVFKSTTTAELIENKQLADFRIKCLVLKYSEAICKESKSWDYLKEIGYIVKSQQRNEFIRNLVLSLEGNSLVLFQLVEKHGKQLHSMIAEKAKNRHVFFVYGGTDVEIRESVREITEKENNAIIVASYGTFSTGVNIRNLHNVIFASPSKSRVRNLQSIGRGLRIGDNKKEAVLFDIADDFRVGKHVNFTLKHFIERVKIYDEEKFKYKFYNIEVKDA